MIYVWLFLGLVFSLTGEFMCKTASMNTGLRMYIFLACGSLAWASSAIVWTQIYKLKSITTALAMFSPLFLVMLAFMGFVLFKEPVTVRTLIGLTLALACVIIMH